MGEWIKLIIAGCVAILAGGYGTGDHSIETLISAAPAYTSVAGTLLGFLIAAVAILTAVVNRRLIQNMVKTGHYRVLLHEMYGTSVALLASTGAGLIAILAPDTWVVNSMWVCVSTLTFGLLLLASAGRKFYIVMINII